MSEPAKKTEHKIVNGIDVTSMLQNIEEVKQDANKASSRWFVTTSWQGGTKTKTHVSGYEIGGEHINKDFTIQTDEPLELGGTNENANPQETLMAAFNSCMTVGYAALCAVEGIELEELSIETSGDIDLRGFFGIDPNIKPGYEQLQYKVHIKGNGTPEQFQKIHEAVCATSPNRYNMANSIKLNGELVVE